MCPRRGWQRVFEKMSAKSGTSLLRFWDVDVSAFRDVVVCLLSMYVTWSRSKPHMLLGAYVPRSRRIYCDMHNIKVFLHKASHHVVSLHMPHLYKTARGRAIEEAVADTAAAVAVREILAPRGVGWQLIEMGLRLKPCSKLRLDRDGDPHLQNNCILTALKAKPRLILNLFP